MSRSIALTMVLGVLAVGACKKGEGDKPEPTSTAKTQETKPTTATDTPAPAGDPIAAVGVEAGGIERDAAEGAAAVISAAAGTVEVRRVGETTFAEANTDTQLWPGDAVRTGEGGAATIALADESVIELSEVSTIAIASREGSADPASSAAVLAGLARFSVTPRTPGEGAFRVYTPGGVVVTRGTVYGIGVAASGQTRIGVESGLVDVIGLLALDAPPVAVEGGASMTIAGTGAVGTPAPWPADDWGTWRADADAEVEIGLAMDEHARAMGELNTWLIDAYLDLTSAADTVATFEATAATSADKGDTAAYEASLPDASATIDASFSLAGRIEALTWANAGHATIATDLYVRHPDVVAPKWQVIAPRVDAAVLWPKRFEVTAAGYLEPLRGQYYLHHPRGRMHASLVGVSVPEFYAKVEPPAIEPERVRGRVKTKIWIAPELQYQASSRPVWISAPSADWRAKIKVRPAPMRANVGWYVRPPALKANVMLGGDIKGKWDSKLAVGAPAPRASLRAAWKVPVGMKIKVGAPDLKAAASARAKFKVGAPGVNVRDHRADVRGRVDARTDVGGKLKGRVDVKAPVIKPPEVRGKVGIGVGVGAGMKAGAGGQVRDHRSSAAGAAGGVKAKAAVKVKAPQVKIKAPQVKVKGQVKGGFKLGN